MPCVESDFGGDWSGVATLPSIQTSNRSRFLRLIERDYPYRVRPVSCPRQFFRHWTVFKEDRSFPVSPATREQDLVADVAWNIGGHKPTRRWAMLVIDREDQQVKYMEGGHTLFQDFRQYRDMTGLNPSAPSSPDWNIYVTRQSHYRSYKATPVNGEGAFTNADASRVLSCGADLEDFNKPLAGISLARMWLDLPLERRYSDAQKVSMSQESSPTSYATDEDIRNYFEIHKDTILVEASVNGKIGGYSVAQIPEILKQCHLRKSLDMHVLPFRIKSVAGFVTPEEKRIESLVNGVEEQWEGWAEF